MSTNTRKGVALVLGLYFFYEGGNVEDAMIGVQSFESEAILATVSFISLLGGDCFDSTCGLLELNIDVFGGAVYKDGNNAPAF